MAVIDQKTKGKKNVEVAKRQPFSCNLDSRLMREFNIAMAVRAIPQKQVAVEQAIKLWVSTDYAVIEQRVSEGTVTINVPRSLQAAVESLIRAVGKVGK